MNSKRYRKLQLHLNRMPVGFPRTAGGIELRILERLFSPLEAQIALAMGHRPEPAESIYHRTADVELTLPAIESILNGMARKGAILNVRRHHRECYALIPYVVGMYEFQAQTLSRDAYLDTLSYFKRGYALEYLSTAVPQTRIIPIRRSLTHSHAVATYDEIRALVRQAGQEIGVAPCICRQGRDLVGAPCSKTDRRSICLVMRDLFEHGRRYGLVRAISADEAMDILDANERAGLVLQPSNEQAPQFVCSCCRCCCGILGLLNALPRPVDFTASNFTASVDHRSCNGCGVCMRRCPMRAVAVTGTTCRVDTSRCIGCGVCVTTCKPAAIELVRKTAVVCPPATTDDLYSTIGDGKQPMLGKAKTFFKVLLSGLQSVLQPSKK